MKKALIIFLMLSFCSIPLYAAEAMKIYDLEGRRIGLIRASVSGFVVIDTEGNRVENPENGYVIMPNRINKSVIDTSYCYIYDSAGNLIRFPQALQYRYIPRNVTVKKGSN